MSRWSIGIVVAALSGVASFLLLPAAWILPLFGSGIAVALVSGIAAQAGAQPRRPVHPAVDLALFAVNLPSDPLARVKSGWSLWSFGVAATYVVSLGLSMLWAAYA